MFVVDEDDSMRDALARTIESGGWFVEAFSSGREFLERPHLAAPSCLVLDIAIGDIDSLDLQRRLAIDRPAMPIIFTARHADIPATVQAIKAGALEFFMKPLCDEELQNAIARAIERSRDARLTEVEILALRASYASLTPRERDVMALVVLGRLNKQAADELGISEITVKAHRGSVMRKMRARTFASLMGMAAKVGLAAV
ncbi:MAG: response regulator transcription factor [Rhodanobacteraceae bacterium]